MSAGVVVALILIVPIVLALATVFSRYIGKRLKERSRS
jgi:hypothetical protein